MLKAVSGTQSSFIADGFNATAEDEKLHLYRGRYLMVLVGWLWIKTGVCVCVCVCARARVCVCVWVAIQR
jgi:hypothetical protein